MLRSLLTLAMCIWWNTQVVYNVVWLDLCLEVWISWTSSSSCRRLLIHSESGMTDGSDTVLELIWGQSPSGGSYCKLSHGGNVFLLLTKMNGEFVFDLCDQRTSWKSFKADYNELYCVYVCVCVCVRVCVWIEYHTQQNNNVFLCVFQ